MRSRFAAYAMGKVAYIMQTTTDQRSDTDVWRSEIKRFSELTTFSNLSIDRVEPGDTVAFVTFTATLTQQGHDVSFTERSRFVRGDRWTYKDGERVQSS